MHSCVKLVTLDIIKYIPQNSKSEKEIHLYHAATRSYGQIYLNISDIFAFTMARLGLGQSFDLSLCGG